MKKRERLGNQRQQPIRGDSIVEYFFQSECQRTNRKKIESGAGKPLLKGPSELFDNNRRVIEFLLATTSQFVIAAPLFDRARVRQFI